MTKGMILLMLQIINNLDVYVTDDNTVEMNEDMQNLGYTDFNAAVDQLRQQLEAMR